MPDPPPAGSRRFCARNSFAVSSSPVRKAGSLSARGPPRPPGAPPSSVLFFKSLHALVHFLTGHGQERLLQCQFHVRVGQRFLGPAQFVAQPGGFGYFVGSFHANYLTIPATAKLPHPPRYRAVTLNVVLSLHRRSTPFPGFHLPHQLQFEAFAISNHFHGSSVCSFPKYHPISGRDLRTE